MLLQKTTTATKSKMLYYFFAFINQQFLETIIFIRYILSLSQAFFFNNTELKDHLLKHKHSGTELRQPAS